MSRLDSAIREITAMRSASDPEVRTFLPPPLPRFFAPVPVASLKKRQPRQVLVTDGIAGGATRITGFRRISCRAVMATASSYGFDAAIPTNHGGEHVMVELTNKEVHTAQPVEIVPDSVSVSLMKHFGPGVSVTGRTRGGACSQFSVVSQKPIAAALLMDVLSTSSVIDVWGFSNKLVVLVAHRPTHTSALTHLRQNKPELFSPQHCRTLADVRSRRLVAAKKGPRRLFKRKGARPAKERPEAAV